ncbi:MAG: AsmA family protein [Candidatus Omnitrophica bacterium]|nr:AsmA family protein [Candidatus Omnitrophota bacterium]
MKHRAFFILIGLIILGAAAFFYIDNIFLPIQFKRFITTRSEGFLHRKVSVDTIDFRPVQGFIVKGVRISRKDDPEKPFIHVDEITFNLLFVPLFPKKAVILPSIKIKNPYVYLARDENGAWNFSDLPGLGKNMKNKNTFSVLLRKFTLVGGKIHLKDAFHNRGFFESIENINLYTTFSVNKGVRFVFQAQVPQDKSALKIKGNYLLFPKKLTAQILAENIYPARYLPIAFLSRPYVNLADGAVSSADFKAVYEGRGLRAEGSFLASDTRIQVGENKGFSGTIHVPKILLSWRDHKWNARGRLLLPSARLSSSDGKVFQGDIAADLNLLTIYEHNMTSQGNVTIENARLALGENRYFKGAIKADNASLVKGDGKIRLQGDLAVEKIDLLFDKLLSLNGDLSTAGTNLTWSRDDSGNNVFDMQTGFILDNARAAFKDNRSISSRIIVPKASISVNQENMIVDALGQLESADILLAENRQFQGSPRFHIAAHLDPAGKAPADYKGAFQFEDGILTGIPYLETMSHLQGAVTVTPDKIRTDGLTFDAQESHIQLSGLMANFSNPTLNIKASSGRADVQKLLSFFPALKKKLRADLTGQASVTADYNGPLLSPADAIVVLSAQLIDATLAHEKLPEDFTGISGRLDYAEDTLKWHNLTAYYGGKPYTFNGELINFSRPVIDTEVASDQLRLTAHINILRSAMQLTSFVGQYLNSTFDLRGDMHFSDVAPADIDMRGIFSLDLRDAGALIPRIKQRTDQLKPAGVLTGEGIFKGSLGDWRNWQLALNMASDRVTLNHYSLRDVIFRFTQRDLAVSKCNLTSKVYGGELAVNASADLRSDAVPFTAAVNLNNVDFAQLRKERQLKDRHLAGILSMTAALEGRAAQWRDMTGNGSLDIVNGHLWQWNILNGISSALLIPEFKNFVFTEARGNFTIGDQKISTSNARMTGKSVTLDGKGWMDFSQNLHFDIKPTFSELAILQSDSLKKGPTAIVTQTEGYLNIKLTGTLKKPKFKVEKSPMKILEGAIGDTTDTLKEVIGGIVDEVF